MDGGLRAPELCGGETVTGVAQIKEAVSDPLAEVDFLGRAFQDDPYPVYAKLIKETPFFYSDRYRQYFAFSAEAVRAVMVSKDFTVESPFRASRIMFGPTVVDLDGENHRRLRIALSEAINVGKNQQYREEIILPTIRERVADLKDGEAQNWVSDFCDLVPLQVMSRIIGIPDSDFDFFKRVCAPIISYLDFATPETKAAGIAAMGELVPYLDDLLAGLVEVGSFDSSIIGSYLRQQHENGQPSMVEITRHVSLLIPAAIDTTNRLIANCIWLLCDTPDLQKKLRGDTAAISNFVTEVMRYEPPIHTTLRLAAKATEVLGVPVPAGAAVTVNLAAAARDPALFDGPDNFDSERPPSNRVLSFGAGKHQCVGKNLATIEICDCVEVLLDTFADIAFAPGPKPQITGTAFRSPVVMPIIAHKFPTEETL